MRAKVTLIGLVLGFTLTVFGQPTTSFPAASTTGPLGTRIKQYSFLNPKVVSFLVTNNVGATNITTISQGATPYGNTNYSLSAAAQFTYTNNAPYWSPTYSNVWYYAGLPQTNSGGVIPGYMCIDVVSNITSSLGLPPVTAANPALVFTNDPLNMFADVPLDSILPNFEPLAQGTGAAGTNILGVLQFQTQNYNGSSNNITVVFVPVPDGTNEITSTGSGLAGGFATLAPFTIVFTNQVATTAQSIAAVQLPQNLVYGSRALRVRSVSGTGGTWIQGINLLTFQQ